jgi:diaminopimelate decarboxylase
MNDIEKLRFLTPADTEAIAEEYGTPVFMYSENVLREQAEKVLSFSTPYGLTVSYAMKANPNSHILAIFRDMGLGIDASSGNEIHRALRAGFEPREISLTAQQLPDDFDELAKSGVQFNLSSLEQLRRWGEKLPGTSVGIRVNPGIGSGHVARTNVGGPSSSFGIWHEYINEAKDIASNYRLTINRLHTHIGSGADPESWNKAVNLSLDIAAEFSEVDTLNIGGGFKVGRMSSEKTTDLHAVSQHVTKSLRRFARQTGRKLHLELEPGSFLTVNAGSLVTKVHDVVDTGKNGYTFLKIDGGMTELVRPAMYGAQHPIVVVNGLPELHKKYVVVGRCCESGDMLTPAPNDPELLAPRLLQQAKIGDYVVIEGVGAYCAAMNVSGYNSIPAAAEVLLKTDSTTRLIRKPQTLEDLLADEVVPTAVETR